MFQFLNNKKKLNLKVNNKIAYLKDDYIGNKFIVSKTNKKICFVASIVENIGNIDIYYSTGYIGKLTFLIYSHDNSVLLSDIEFDDKFINEGIGCMLVRYFEEVITDLGSKYIHGNICRNDLINHEDRLLHFYGKLGYKISNNEDTNFVYKADKIL